MATVSGYLLRREWSILSHSWVLDQCLDPRRVPSRHLPQTTIRGDNPRLETLMKTRLLLLLIGFFALESACLARGSKPGKSAPGPGPTTTAVDPTKYLNRDWENVYNQGRTGDHLRGNVTLAEGALPWDAIPVVVMCDGKAKFTTTTDSHGDLVIARVQPVASTTIIGTETSLVGRLFRLGRVARF